MNNKIGKLSAAFVAAAILTVGIGTSVSHVNADESAEVTTTEISTLYGEGQTFGRKLKFVDGEASIKLKTEAAALEKLVLLGFYPEEGSIPDANPAGKNKGVSFVGYPTGELELYNNEGWKQLTQAAGSTSFFGDKKKVTFTLARETVEESVHYKLYYTPDGGEKTLWNDLSSGLSYNGYTYDFSDGDVMISDGCTYFGAKVLHDCRNLTVYEYKTTVEGVSFANGEGAKIVEVYDGKGNAYPVSASGVTSTGYEFTTTQQVEPVSAKFENAYGTTATAALTETQISFESDSFAVGTHEFTQSLGAQQEWNAYDNGGFVTVTDGEGIDLNLGVQGNGGQFGIFFLPTNGVGWPTAIPANGFCVFFTNADGNRLCPEVYMNYEGNGWKQLTTTSDPSGVSFPWIDPAPANSSEWTDMKFSLKKIDGEWGIYINDVLVPFKGHAQLADTPYSEYVGKDFNPLAVAFPGAEWRNAEGKTNFGFCGWSGDNAVRVTVPKVRVEAQVDDLYGAAEMYAEIKAYGETGGGLSLVDAKLTETGAEYVSFDADKIKKFVLSTAGGVTSEFSVDYAARKADEKIVLGSAEGTYDKTVTVKDKDGNAVVGAEVLIKDGEKDVTDYMKIIDNGDGTYTVRGVNKTLSVRFEREGMNAVVELNGDSGAEEVVIYGEYSVTLTLKDGLGNILGNMESALSVYTGDKKEAATISYDAEKGAYILSGLYETGEEKTVRFSAEGYASARTTVTAETGSTELVAVRLYSVELTLKYAYGEGADEKAFAVPGAEEYVKVYASSDAVTPDEGFAVTYADGKYTVSGIREDAPEKWVKFEMEGYGTRMASVTYATASEGISMTTERIYTAVVRVLDGDGKPVEDAVLIAESDGEFEYDEGMGAYILAGQTDVVTVTIYARDNNRTVTITPEDDTVTVVLVDFSGLKAAIDEAKSAIRDVAVSADGADVYEDKKWTTQAALDALGSAIEEAERVLADVSADKATVDGAKNTLEAATEAFKETLKNGTKIAAGAIKTMEVLLNGKITVRFGVYISEETAADASAYLSVTVGNQSRQMLISEAKRNESGYALFEVDVAAAQMTEAIRLRVVSSSAQSAEVSYTVREYADHILSVSEDDKQIALVRAMLDYGAYAQKLFNVNVTELANEGIHEGDDPIPSVTGIDASATTTGSVPGAELKEFDLLLQTDCTLRLYYTLENATGYTAIVRYTDGTEKTFLLEIVEGEAEKEYYIDIPHIPAPLLDTVYSVTIKYSDGTEMTTQISALTYAAAVLGSENASEAQKNLARALYLYNVAANEYFNE